MTTFADTKERVDFSGAFRQLKEKLSSCNLTGTYPHRIRRVELELETAVPLFNWLRASTAVSKIYWSSRNGDFEMAGVGECLLLSAEAYTDVDKTIEQSIRLVKESAEGVRIYGGIRFPTAGKNGKSSDWTDFKSCRFIVPRFEIIKRNNQTKFACNLISADAADYEKVLNELNKVVLSNYDDSPASSDIVSRTDLPAFDGWENNFTSIVRDFSNGKIEKIVLARQTTIQFRETCDALRLLARLAAATPGCYHFYFQPKRGTSFLGASPEQLYSRKNRDMTSEALAGTKPRGNDLEADTKLGQELLHSEKELREHKYVVDNIKAALTVLCEHYSAKDSPSLLKLAQVQHLRTEFRGKLRADVSDTDIISALHPTSAVGGFPSEAAQSRIAECEQFDRGWYAGAVGWLAKDTAEMAVAIRSGLVIGNQLKLHSGAGIINGSTARGEWEEIESKIGSFISAVSG